MGKTPTSILLIDDKPQRLLSYRAILDSLELNVVEARSGENGIHKLDETDFSAILLDVNMPGLNGFETAARIRNHPRGSKTPIIFVTGVHFSDLDRIRGYEMGAADYVFVPVVPEILRAKIKVLVQLHEQRLAVTHLNAKLVRANEELEQAHKQLQAENMRELRKLNESLATTNHRLESEIGERVSAERKLMDEARRKDEFISILAHELRNPLSAIQSGMEVMRLPSLPEGKAIWAQKLVQRQVSHLVRLIDDLLDVSRVTSGRVQLQSEIVDVRQVLRDTIDAMQPRISELNHSLTTDMPYDPLYVVGDAVRLGQVFGNLLANAAKYMDPGGCIEVTAQTRHGDDRRVEISVIDAGTGLDASMLDYVFELFAQAQPVGSHAESGLGIGLALVRELVELHGGSVRAESDGPGCGSRFIVELPLTDQLPVAAGATGSKPRTSPARLLVIDDNVDAASALAFLLERISGHEVQVAGDAERGIHAAVESKPDVIFLDIGLPDLNGCEVARRLRDILGGECGHLVAITGFGTGQTAVSHDDAAFDCILTKPVAYAELERLLGRITGASGQPGMTPGVDSQPAMGCRPASQLASPLS